MGTQKDRNETMTKISQMVDKVLFIKNKRNLTEQEKDKGFNEWLATPEGIKKMRTRYIISGSLVFNISSVLYRLPGYKLFVAAYMALFGGIAAWYFMNIKFVFIIGLAILLIGHIEGLIYGIIIVDEMYDKSIIQYALPENVSEMVARHKKRNSEFGKYNQFERFSDEDNTFNYGYYVFRYSGMTAEQAKKEYKNLVKLYHPDNSDNPCSAEILENLKKEYDMYAKYAKLIEELGAPVQAPCLGPQAFEDVEICI